MFFAKHYVNPNTTPEGSSLNWDHYRKDVPSINVGRESLDLAAVLLLCVLG